MIKLHFSANDETQKQQIVTGILLIFVPGTRIRSTDIYAIAFHRMEQHEAQQTGVEMYLRNI